MDFVKNTVGGKMQKDAQPGNSVEGRGDNAANQQTDKLATSAGIPQKADGAINKAVDGKINKEIPGGNN